MVEVSNESINNIKEKIISDAIKQTDMPIITDYQSLQNAANLYLKNVELIQTDLSIALDIKRIAAGSSTDVITKINDIIASAYQARQLSSVYFMDALDKYLDNLPRKAIFVVTDNKGKKYDMVELSMEQLAKLINYENRLVTNISKKNRANYSSFAINNDHNQQITAAYQGTNNRLARYYEAVKRKQQQGGLLLFKQSNDWTVVRVANEGVIKEAYAAAALTKHQSTNDILCQTNRGSPQFYSHELIGNFYNYYIAKVTNAEAIVEEDIVLSDDGVQYGIKSRRAVFDTSSQTENIAQKIINSTSELSPSALKSIISQEYNRNAQLAPIVKNILTDIAEDETDFIQDIINNSY